MRKRVFGKKLGRNTNSRKALFRSLVSELVKNGKIKTTTSKAKAVQPNVEKLLTKVKKDSLASRRAVLASLGNDRKTTDKLFSEFKHTLEKRTSGFTKITKLGKRRGDNVQLALLEFVDPSVESVKVETKKGSKLAK